MRLRLQDLTVIRGERVLIENLELTISAGTSLLLEGANGSGKTSLLRAVAGLLRPHRGTVRIERSDKADCPVAEHAHFVGHADGVKGNLTIGENLDFWRRFMGGGSGGAETLDLFGLRDLGDVPVHFLSAGQKKKVGLARLMVAPRPLWLLDEPSVSLDTSACKVLADMMQKHVDDGGMLVAASHADLGIDFDQRCRLGSVR